MVIREALKDGDIDYIFYGFIPGGPHEFDESAVFLDSRPVIGFGKQLNQWL